MKKIIFGIFAHPDDEAFGPSATLMKEIATGTEVHLICVTRGENGVNSGTHLDLGEVRMQEWREACRQIGVTENYMLDYQDGTLCNNNYHEIASTIETLIREVCTRNEAIELCMMTFDSNGLTGHLDHIAISYITTFVFYLLQAKPPTRTVVKELAYFCMSKKQMPQPNHDYFVFMPAGHSDDYITRRVDVSALVDRKFDVLRTHRTQRKDAQQSMNAGRAFHEVDNFRVITS